MLDMFMFLSKILKNKYFSFKATTDRNKEVGISIFHRDYVKDEILNIYGYSRY